MRGLCELGGDGRDEHGEASFVVGRRGEQVCDGGDGWAELGGHLGGCYDGDGEGFGEVEELLGGEDDSIEFVYGSAELVLDVADKNCRVLEPQLGWSRSRHGAKLPIGRLEGFGGGGRGREARGERPVLVLGCVLVWSGGLDARDTAGREVEGIECRTRRDSHGQKTRSSKIED